MIPLPKFGFNPIEAAVSWKTLVSLGHKVRFATPDGKPSLYAYLDGYERKISLNIPRSIPIRFISYSQRGADKLLFEGFLYGFIKILPEPLLYDEQMISSQGLKLTFLFCFFEIIIANFFFCLFLFEIMT